MIRDHVTIPGKFATSSMLLEPYTPAFIIGVMVTCIIVVGLIGLLCGALGLIVSRSALRLGLYGSYTGAIPGGVIGYVASSGNTAPLSGFIYAIAGGGIGALLGAIAGVGWTLLGQRQRSRIRHRFTSIRQTKAPGMARDTETQSTASSSELES